MRQFLSTLLIPALLWCPILNAPIAFAQQAIGEPATPIRHVVVIFDENISFDHYFGTYPHAKNPPGEPSFYPAPDTPSVNGILGGLSKRNPNAVNPANGTGAANPFRLDRSQALTADQNHDYTAEQTAFHRGLMDLFPMATGSPGPPPNSGPPVVRTTGLVMGYYDGNTLTALWNYAQRFALSDSFFGTTFGPSTVGAINLISGQTNGVLSSINGFGSVVPDGYGGYTMIGDPDPLGDICSASDREQVRLGGKNIGDLLNDAGVTWGWFEGGFDLKIVNPNGTTGCNRSHTSPFVGVTTNDYIPHHEPFQYYASTANLQHTRPTSVAMIGHQGDAANHQYDIRDFYAAVQAGNFPAVSFLKAPAYRDGHPGYSDPLDEQQFIVHVINFLQAQSEWGSTAVIIAYDDSDGWYDHVMGPIMNQSTTSADALTDKGMCGNGQTALRGIEERATHVQGRCGYGPRLPLLVISRWAKRNYVDHTVTDQTSILRFIEDNWLDHERIGQGSFDEIANSLRTMFDFDQISLDTKPLLLSEDTGQPAQ